MLGSELCRSLPGLHIFTGYDSVSTFSGKGKVTGLKLVKTSHFKPYFKKYSPSAESRKFGFMAHLRGTAETCLILIY